MKIVKLMLILIKTWKWKSGPGGMTSAAGWKYNLPLLWRAMLLKRYHWDEDQDGDEDGDGLDHEDDKEKYEDDNKDDMDAMVIICERLTCVLILTKVPRD